MPLDTAYKTIMAISPFRELTPALAKSLFELTLIRTFDKHDAIINYQIDLILQKYICFVIDGGVAIRDKAGKFITTVFRGQYFLGRPFSMEGKNAAEAVSIADNTTVLFVEKPILSKVVRLAPRFHTRVAEGYETVLQRARMLARDPTRQVEIRQLLDEEDPIAKIERLFSAIEREEIEQEASRSFDTKLKLVLFTTGLIIPLILLWESWTRSRMPEYSASRVLFDIQEIGPYSAGAPFNVNLGIAGAILIFLTNIHTLLKWVNRTKMAINLRRSLAIHIFFGIVGPIFVIYHTGFSLFKINVATVSFWIMVFVVISGFFGRYVYGLIPRTIQGQKLELSALIESEEQLKRKAELLMDNPAQHKTVIQEIVGTMHAASYFWVIPTIQNMLRIYRIQRMLNRIGFDSDECKLLVDILRQEAWLKRRIALLDLSNAIFKRWIGIHKPVAYFLFLMIMIHAIVVTIF